MGLSTPSRAARTPARPGPPHCASPRRILTSGVRQRECFLGRQEPRRSRVPVRVAWVVGECGWGGVTPPLPPRAAPPGAARSPCHSLGALARVPLAVRAGLLPAGAEPGRHACRLQLPAGGGHLRGRGEGKLPAPSRAWLARGLSRRSPAPSVSCPLVLATLATLPAASAAAWSQRGDVQMPFWGAVRSQLSPFPRPESTAQRGDPL